MNNEKKQETSKDIVAEMRDATMNGEYDDATVDAWADRVEAAWRAERERAGAMRREKRGNAAAILSNRTITIKFDIAPGGVKVDNMNGGVK